MYSPGKYEDIKASDEKHIKNFLDYKIEYYSITGSTYDVYSRFMHSIASEFHLKYMKSLAEITPKELLDVRRVLEKRRNGKYASVKSNALLGFIKWAMLPDVALLPEDFHIIRVERSRKQCRMQYIPTASDVFKIRASLVCQNLVNACMFEILISSGMRVGELFQMRPCDLNFNVDVADNELRKISPFVGCSLKVGPNYGIDTKYGKHRIVYIGKLATKLLLQLMKQRGTPINSNAPFFPYATAGLTKLFIRFGSTIEEFKKMRKEGVVSKERRPSAIEMKNLKGPREYIEAVNRLRAKAASKTDYEKRVDELSGADDGEPRKSKVSKVSLSPHCLRHFFGVLMYYRNYFGNRRDMIGVRDLLGHEDVDITNRYIKFSDHIKNDYEWKQILLGNGMDYAVLSYNPDLRPIKRGKTRQ